METISMGQILLYLLNCAVNQRKPEGLPEDTDFEKLKELSRFHSVTAMVSYALDAGGYLSEKYMSQELIGYWTAAQISSIRKKTMFDMEREAILNHFEENQVWYMPLKGCILKDMYPDICMREMADNDILFDESYRQGLCDFMKTRGYTVKVYNKSVHDVYVKKPFYNFEFHVDLIDEDHGDMGNYYVNIKDRLLKDEGNGYGYHFTDEDFYIYMIAHAMKHYHSAGTGIRILADIYVYSRAKGKAIDWTYIDRELAMLGEAKVEGSLRQMAMDLFDPERGVADMIPQTEEQIDMLEYLFGSGTYGTVVNHVHKDLEEIQGEEETLTAGMKFRFLMKRLIPDAKHMGQYSPFCKRHKWAIPVFWGYRIVRGVAKRGTSIASELRAVKNAK